MFGGGWVVVVVVVWGGGRHKHILGFDAVISLLTADPEPVSSPETWIYRDCAPEKHQLNILNLCFCVLVLPNCAFWVGGGAG